MRATEQCIVRPTRNDRVTIHYSNLDRTPDGEALTGTSQSVWAQDDEASEAMLEEIIVTATRREMSPQDVPMAISAVGQEQIVNMDDYLRSIPSLSLIDGRLSGI